MPERCNFVPRLSVTRAKIVRRRQTSRGRRASVKQVTHLTHYRGDGQEITGLFASRETFRVDVRHSPGGIRGITELRAINVFKLNNNFTIGV